MGLKGYIEIDREFCKGCKLCIEFCPKGVISLSSNLNVKGYHPAYFTEEESTKEKRKCTGCSICAIVCPEVAIEVYRG
ncbi:MAG: ferredoxin family protein [Thermodesulfobacteriota bacterium]